uniref:Uncharacterized protein n=1 Tax=Anguilla anguilla TaxID=7936 RepID=A0A0E9QJC7_ANGAN
MYCVDIIFISYNEILY